MITFPRETTEETEGGSLGYGGLDTYRRKHHLIVLCLKLCLFTGMKGDLSSLWWHVVAYCDQTTGVTGVDRGSSLFMLASERNYKTCSHLP